MRTTPLLARIGLAVPLLASLGCFHHHDHGPDAHVVVYDAQGYRHEGFHDDRGDWHGGYYDEHNGYHDDPHDFR